MPRIRILSNREKRAIALDASVDIRTLDAYLAGRTVRGLCGERIEAALAARGLLQATA
jgi:hypothetical protein